MTFFQLGLRRAAAQLSRLSAACGPCLLRHQAPARPVSRIVQLARTSRRLASTAAEPESPLGSLSSNISKSANLARKTSSARRSGPSSSFPETNAKAVGYWLVGSAVSVFGIVIWGGLTRLTESGYVDELSLMRYCTKR